MYEFDSLRLNRDDRIFNLKKLLGQECLTSDSESFMLSFTLNPDGSIEDHEIMLEQLEMNNSIDFIHTCLKSKIEISKINLGEIKPLNTSRQSRVFSTQYNLLIKKKTKTIKELSK